jgi:hypothetical protein
MGEIIEKNYYLTARHTNIFKVQKQLENKPIFFLASGGCFCYDPPF